MHCFQCCPPKILLCGLEVKKLNNGKKETFSVKCSLFPDLSFAFTNAIRPRVAKHYLGEIRTFKLNAEQMQTISPVCTNCNCGQHCVFKLRPGKKMEKNKLIDKTLKLVCRIGSLRKLRALCCFCVYLRCPFHTAGYQNCSETKRCLLHIILSPKPQTTLPWGPIICPR